MNKRKILLFTLFLISTPASASLTAKRQNKEGAALIKTYYQHIERTTEYIIEKDDDLDYSFNKYYIKLDEQLDKRLSFMLNYVNYGRVFKEEPDLNNKIKDFKNSWDYYFLKGAEKSLKLDFNLGYKEMRYKNNETQDFNKTKINGQLTYKKKDSLWAGIKAGYEHYNFINKKIKDRNIYSGGLAIKKYLYEKNLILIGNIKLKQVDSEEKYDKEEYELLLGADIKTGHNILEKIILRGLAGERNTIEDEEYEEELDYDYQYKLAKIKTVHKLTKKLQTSIRGEINARTYSGVDYDYNSYLIGNKWDWKHFLSGKKKKYTQFSLDFIHSETEYDIMENSSHYKNGVNLILGYKMSGRWSYEIELGASQYRYEFSEKDRNTYHAGATISRKFFDNKFEINLEYDYRIKDYLSPDRRNIYQHSFLLGGILKF